MILFRNLALVVLGYSLFGCAVLTPKHSARTPAQVAQCHLPTSSETIKLAGITMTFTTLTNPYRMEIVGTPFAKRTQKIVSIINSRRALDEDPLSDRKYWNKKAKIEPHYKDDAYSLFPELFIEERFSASLSMQKASESEWAKLGYIIGQEPVLRVTALPKIWQFAQTSAKCFGRVQFSTSPYGRFAQQHLDDLLTKTPEQLLHPKEQELVQALKSNQIYRIEKLRYHSKPIGNNPLIVTHPSREFDEEMIAKPGIDKHIALARKENRQVVFLMQYDNAEDVTQYYYPEKNDIVMYSSAGEHSFTPGNNQATVVGNFFGLCQGSAIEDVITRYFVGKTSGSFKVTIPLAASRTHYQDAHPVDNSALMTMDTYLEKAGAAAFQKLVEKYFLKPTHFGSDEYFAYGHGPEYKMVSSTQHRVSYTEYSFVAALDGKEFLKRGSGPRMVRLEFLSR